MPYQPLLPGFQEPPPQRPQPLGERPRNDHLFLAVLPEPDATSCIFNLGQLELAKHGLRGKPIAKQRLHVTPASLGHFSGRPEWIIAVADAAARATAAATSPFDVGFNRAGSFVGRPDNRPFVLRDRGDNAALMTFQQRLWADLGGKGRSAFTPHVTLLYDEQLVPEEEVRPVRWTVSEFVLIHSFVGHSRYETLGRWTLRGRH